MWIRCIFQTDALALRSDLNYLECQCRKHEPPQDNLLISALNTFQALPEFYLQLHDQQAVKMQVLREASHIAAICESEVTAHFVLLEPFFFGNSIAHFPF